MSKQGTEQDKNKGSNSDKTKSLATKGTEPKATKVPTKSPGLEPDKRKGTKPCETNIPVVKSSEQKTDNTETKTPAIRDNKNSDSVFKSPSAVSDVKSKKTRTLTDSSSTEDSVRKPSANQSGTSVTDLTKSSENPEVDLTRKNTDKSSSAKQDKIPGQTSTDPSPGRIDKVVPQELRLSSSTDDGGQPAKEHKGPNIKYTKKKRMLSAHPWALPPTRIVDSGPWVCRLCTARPLKTASGTRRHYGQHYKIWRQSDNTYRDMTAVERDQHGITRAEGKIDGDVSRDGTTYQLH